MGLRHDIARAGNLMGDRTPEEVGILVADVTNLDYLRIIDEKRFLRSRYTGPPISVSSVSQEYNDWLLKYVLRHDVLLRGAVGKPPPPPCA